MRAPSSANHFTDRNRRPWPFLMLLEGRAFLELGATLAAMPLLQRAPRGDGHAVLVLPGLLASDRSTTLLRRFLSGLGYDVEGWSQGQNRGPRAGVEERMTDTLRAMRERSHGKVSVIGWSLGGIHARSLARRHPGDEDEDVDIDYHIRHITLPKPGTLQHSNNTSRACIRRCSIAVARCGKCSSSTGCNRGRWRSTPRCITPA